MIRNILADVLIGLGILLLIIGLLFVFNVWPVAGESNQRAEQTDNNITQNQTKENTKKEDNEFNITQEYIEQEKVKDFKTDFAWERKLSFNTNSIDFEKEFSENMEEKENLAFSNKKCQKQSPNIS